MIAHLRTKSPSHAPVHPILGIMHDPPDGGSRVDEVEIESREPLRGGVHHVISPLSGDVPSLWTSVPKPCPEMAQGYRGVISLVPQIELSPILPRREMSEAGAGVVFHTDVRASGIVAKSEKHWQTVFDDSEPPGLLDGAEEPPRTYMISDRLPRLKPRGAQGIWRKRL